MNFQVGETVMHWSHGLGQVTGLEERKVVGESHLYYAVDVQEIHIWVPADAQLASRLRQPTSAHGFKRLQAILSGPAEALPDDRHDRKTHLRAKMAGGDAASRCHVIRDLTARARQKSLNEDDRSTLNRARALLLGEWEYALHMPRAEAEDGLQELLKAPPEPPTE